MGVYFVLLCSVVSYQFNQVAGIIGGSPAEVYPFFVFIPKGSDARNTPINF